MHPWNRTHRSYYKGTMLAEPFKLLIRLSSHLFDSCCIFCSRIFLAGKKVMQIALGRSPADEAKTGLHKLSKVSSSFSQFSRHCVPISRPLIWGFDESNFAVFSSFKVTLVCSLPIFQGMMLRGTIRMPSPLLTFLVLAYINIDTVIYHTGRMFREFEEHDFARTGSTATETVF